MNCSLWTALLILFWAVPQVLAGPPADDSALSDRSKSGELAVQQGCHWLITQQSPDGGWHSRTYGRMKPGAGNTALVLDTLSRLPARTRDNYRPAFERGIAFLTARRTPEGLVQLTGESADYPVYATALLITAIRQFPEASRRELTQTLNAGLLRTQRTTGNGWSPERKDLGGWSPWPASPDSSEMEFPANISVTACALAALQAADALTPEARAAAVSFIHQCNVQIPGKAAESGWIFTPQADSPLNKGGLLANPDGGSVPRPYHSTTCDGVRALLASGFSASDKELAASLIALGGFPPPALLQLPLASDQELPPQSALFFYDAAAFSHVWRQTADDRFKDQRASILQALLQSQQKDGSWKNPLPWFHEDDPLVATALAITALVQLQH